MVLSNVDPGVTLTEAARRRPGARGDVASGSTTSTTAPPTCRCTSPSTGSPSTPRPFEFLNRPEMQASLSYFASAEDMQKQYEDCCRGIIPEDPSFGAQIPSIYDPSLAPEGKHAMSAFAMYFPVEADRREHGRLKDEMAAEGHRQDDAAGAELPGHPHPAHDVRVVPLRHDVRRSATATSATASSTPSSWASSGRCRGAGSTCRSRSRASTSAAPAATAGPGSRSPPATTLGMRRSRTTSPTRA